MLGHGTHSVRVTFCFDALSVDDGLNPMRTEGFANSGGWTVPYRVWLSDLLEVVRTRLCTDGLGTHAGLPQARRT